MGQQKEGSMATSHNKLKGAFMPPPALGSSTSIGNAAEDRALAHLQAAGLHLVARNVKSPGRGGGEVDLIMRESNGTLVFVEVRQRHSSTHGGAAASVGGVKQRRLVFAARHFLARWRGEWPPCRFDVVALEGETPHIAWLQGAFDAASWD
jgi:putative endonuclease